MEAVDIQHMVSRTHSRLFSKTQRFTGRTDDSRASMIFATALPSMHFSAGTARELMSKVGYRSWRHTWGMFRSRPPLTICTSSSRSEPSPAPGLPNVLDRSSVQRLSWKGGAHEDEFQPPRLVSATFFHGTSPSSSLHESAHDPQLSRQPGASVALRCFSSAPAGHCAGC